MLPPAYDDEGYDAEGYDHDGLDRDGYDYGGFNLHGLDRHGYRYDDEIYRDSYPSLYGMNDDSDRFFSSTIAAAYSPRAAYSPTGWTD